ncbi:serine threonine- kinase [Chlorella sorokiniana]|uniref:Serine threonine-kinase n=1 Tax=Chlorella sorokiniana TaxID=3076 RepID=A0A2P6TP38_CHLSO|nr:serine threonine- kinase [Chlorella sorokiniana]|eukprot:PRW51095.1 serine threonine- kinase [Chlorella sorokiniana]
MVGDQPSLHDKAAEVAARVPGLAPWAAQFLAENTHGWEEAVVKESDISFVLGREGQPISLGAGAFGSVWRVVLGGHTECAAKIVEWGGRAHNQEAAMLRRLRHPNVVSFQAICITDLHHCRVLHMDLKPHNVLLTESGSAKIGDVGFSRFMSRTHLTISGRFGTFDWCAPEVLLGRGATEASDIWSYGVVLHQIISGQSARRGQMPPLRAPEQCPAEVAALQRACVSEEPSERPTASEVLEVLSELPPSRRCSGDPRLPSNDAMAAAIEAAQRAAEPAAAPATAGTAGQGAETKSAAQAAGTAQAAAASPQRQRSGLPPTVTVVLKIGNGSSRFM